MGSSFSLCDAHESPSAYIDSLQSRPAERDIGRASFNQFMDLFADPLVDEPLTFEQKQEVDLSAKELLAKYKGQTLDDCDRLAAQKRLNEYLK